MSDASEWHVVKATAERQAQEAIEFFFNQLDSLGTEIQEFKRAETDKLIVLGYFTARPEAADLDEQLQFSLNAYGLPHDVVFDIEHETIEKTDWLSEWKKHWRPTRVGRFVIAPEWEELDADDRGSIVIRIEPNMAFGTGTHETTRLCLKAIDQYLQPDMSFLDVGTGTGILAIAAAVSSPNVERIVSACDTDEDAVMIAMGNAKTNHVENRVAFRQGAINDVTEPHDMVCANLTAGAIVPALSLLLARSHKVLVLSGILAEQQHEIEQALRAAGCMTWKVNRSNEWLSIVVEKI